MAFTGICDTVSDTVLTIILLTAISDTSIDSWIIFFNYSTLPVLSDTFLDSEGMSSIIAFTYSSKWNHLNRTSLSSVIWLWRLPKRAACCSGTSICSKNWITSARPDHSWIHVVFPRSNYHNFPVKKRNLHNFGLRTYKTWCQPFPNKFHRLRAVCVQWFQRTNTVSPRTLGP